MSEEKDLKHVGIARRSGRYPWGSGKDPQRSTDFSGYINMLKKQGLSEVQRAEAVGMNTAQLRSKLTLLKEERKRNEMATAMKLKEKGYSNLAIAKRMGVNDKYVASLLNPMLKEKNDITKTTADILKNRLKSVDYLDVGAGVERRMGISRTKLKTALKKLEQEEGYTLHTIKVNQIGTDKKTTILVLAKPGVTTQEVSKNRANIRLIEDYSEDGGRTYTLIKPIQSVDSKRVLIRYNEEGGALKDGLIELRRGVDDISLGNARYAQVRIGVDGTHYMKGMAVHTDDIPKGYDMVYNSNKKKGTDKYDVFKKMEDDPENPFGSVVRQKEYIDKDGNKKVSALNIVNDEGTWATWSKNLSSQMLSKQPQALAKKQLKNNYDLYKEQYDEIMSLTNPAVRKRLLLDFSSKVDAEAAHLKAAAMPRQANKVLIPIPSLKPNEIYAPGYRDGETVVLIRHPHGGIFEIPELVVNNRNKEGQKILTSNPKDAVGIHPKAAEQLSGADFDGDAVLVIPNNDRSIKTSKPLDRLKDFDPKTSYKETPGMTYMSKKGIGKAMGDISNLITDMTIKGANNDEIANAVRHSMVVIDAYKHKLDYTRSARDHRIPELKKRYQGKSTGGASTLISLASAETRVNQRKERIEIDPKTGKIKYFETGDTYVDKKGKVQPKTIKVTRMSVEDDARKLSSGTPIEEIYADHANRLKALANTSRKDYVTTPNIQRSPTAAVTYKREVDSLKSKLNLAEGEQDRERQAQIIANSKLRLLKENEPALYEEKDKLKKIKGKLIDEARSIVRDGAKREKIDITTKEWEAIQSGAVSNNMLTKILNKADMDQVKSYAMPRTVKEITPAKETRIKAMLDRGYTQAEIGDQLGLSTSIISKFVQ